MIGLGYAEIMVLLLLSGGVTSTDLVSLVEPSEYFKSRRVEPTIDSLIDIVIAEPKTPKAQIIQLMALRHLAAESDRFKAAKNYATNRLAIEEIADGMRGNDPQGFAQDYARRVLAKLDGKKPTPEKLRPLRDGVVDWFPAEAKFVYAADTRQATAGGGDVVKNLLKQMPIQARNEMYDMIEKTGNVRIERTAFAMIDAVKRDDEKFIVRITGKGNPAWLAPMLATLAGGNFQARQLKDADDIPITILQENQGPAIALIGDTDMLFIGFHGFDRRAEDIVTEVLDVRAKKKPNATGALKDRLAKIPDKAVALLVGDLPSEVKRELSASLTVVPTRISAYAERTAQGLEIKGEATLANAADAGKFLKGAGSLRKQGVAELQNAMKEPMPPGLPPVPFQAMIDLVDSVQMQSKGAAVEARAFVPNSLIQQVGRTALQFAGQGFDAPLPPAK